MRPLAALRGNALRRVPSLWARQNSSAQAAESSEPAHEPRSQEGWTLNQEQKTVTTVTGDLPLSPFMDEGFIEAREKHQQPKQRETPTHRKNKWRKALARNPFAQALATPTRICVATRTVHPSFFLQDFKPMAHPETGKPWWMPAKLSLPSPGKHDDKVHREQSKAQAGYMLNSQELIHHIDDNRSSVFQRYRRLYTSQTRSDLLSISKNAVWRKDMDELVLKLMRERVFGEMAYLAQLSRDDARGYVVPLESWEEASKYESGCILWDSSTESVGDMIGVMADADEARPVGNGVSLADSSAYTGKLPIFDVCQLLGDKQWRKLRGDAELLAGSKLFWLGRQRSLDVQLMLWKLQGYTIHGRQEGAAAEDADPQPSKMGRKGSEYAAGDQDLND